MSHGYLTEQEEKAIKLRAFARQTKDVAEAIALTERAVLYLNELGRNCRKRLL